MDPAIKKFLEENYLSPKLKPVKTEEEIRKTILKNNSSIQNEENRNKANEKLINENNKNIEHNNNLKIDFEVTYSLENWLPIASVKVKSHRFVTHPVKYTNPSVSQAPISKEKKNPQDIGSIIFNGKKINDGFVRTGNVDNLELDSSGNAADLKYIDFLFLKLKDGKPIYQHLLDETSTIKELFDISSMSFEDLKKNFLIVFEKQKRTSTKIKQVYFPVDNDYHLLSVLTPSGILFELNNRINEMMKFSDSTKENRKLRKDNNYSEKGFDEIFDLTKIGFGGTNFQNISMLNSKNGGKAYLLQSVPPTIEKRKIHLPRYSFFQNSLWLNNYKENFMALHRLFKLDYNNKNIREGRDNIISHIIEKVITEMWTIRSYSAGWSESEAYNKLPSHEKIWLDEINKEKRDDSDEWLETILRKFSRWFIKSYKSTIGSSAYTLGDQELLYIEKLLDNNKEALK